MPGQISFSPSANQRRWQCGASSNFWRFELPPGRISPLGKVESRRGVVLYEGVCQWRLPSPTQRDRRCRATKTHHPLQKGERVKRCWKHRFWHYCALGRLSPVFCDKSLTYIIFFIVLESQGCTSSKALAYGPRISEEFNFSSPCVLITSVALLCPNRADGIIYERWRPGRRFLWPSPRDRSCAELLFAFSSKPRFMSIRYFVLLNTKGSLVHLLCIRSEWGPCAPA